MLKTVASKGAEVCVLGEMFNCPYDLKKFKNYAEDPLNHSPKKVALNENSKTPSIDLLQYASYKLNLLLIGGSIPISTNNKIYNRCLIYDQGNLLGYHDKVHPFDINMENGPCYKESDFIEPGSKISVFKTRFGKFGIGICYDIRFAEYAMALRKLGAQILFYPSVFTSKTG